MSVKADLFSLFLYFAGRFAHNDAPRISFTFGAPNWLSILCGRPLPSSRLEFSPMVVQLGGVLILLASLAGDSHLLSSRMIAWIRVTAFLMVLLLFFLGSILRGLKNIRQSKSTGNHARQ